jgi:hypothetical protein
MCSSTILILQCQRLWWCCKGMLPIIIFFCTIHLDISDLYTMTTKLEQWPLCTHFRIVTITKVGFQVLTAMVIKISIFWDIMLCSMLKVKWCFRRKCSLHLQDQQASEAKNQHEADSKQSLISRLVPTKCWVTFNRLYTVTSQKTQLLITDDYS